MRNRRWMVALSAVILGALVLSGCGSKAPGGAGAAGSAAAKRVLHIAMQYDLGTLDPALLTSVTDKQMATNLYDGLVRYKLGTTQIEGDLADKWEPSADGLQWTFHLHKGVQFQKGYGELKASDVEFTFDRLKDPALKSAPGKLLNAIKSVDIVDDYSVRLVLSKPDPALLDKLANSVGYIVSRKAVTEKGAKYGQDPVGTGAYQFDTWSPQQQTVYVANPKYFRGMPGLDQVVYVPIPDSTTMYNAFEAGDVDMLQITDPDKLAKYKNDASVAIYSTPGLITRFFGMNGAVKPFDNKLVREAVVAAVDRDSILNNVFKGMSTPASGILAPNVADAVTGIWQPKYAPAAAKALLAQANLPNGFKTTMYVPNIDRFTKPAQVIQENLKAIGIDVNLQVMETQQFLAQLKKGQMPMFMLSRGQDGTPDRVLYTWFSKAGIPADNRANIDIPQVNAWLDEATSTMDEAKRQTDFGNVQRQIAGEDYYYFLDHENQTFALKSKFTGFVGDPQRSIRLDNVTVQGVK